MLTKYPLRLSILALAPLFAAAGTAGAAPYRVFDWQGKAAPVKPTGAGSTTQTAYLNAGRFWDGVILNTMDVNINITVSTWSDPAKWKVDP